MPKTPAQRAARARRRRAKAARKRGMLNNSQAPQRPRKAPLFRNPVPVKAPKRAKFKGGLAASMMSFGADASGLNKSVGFTNRSVVEQVFAPRMEKVADLTGTTAFSMAQALYINPGNTSLFPIFSQEAAVYEQYRCNLLRFWYRSTEYTASGSNIGAGLVLLATNFDPDDAQFANATAMENYWHGTSDAPFAPSGKGVLMHDVLAGYRKNRGGSLRDASLNNYYVNPSANTAAPGSNAAKFYDIGLFQLATDGNVSSADKIGELWVEYSFTMIHPKQPEYPVGGTAIHIKLYADDATTASPLGLTPYTTGHASSTGASVSGVVPGSTLSVVDMSGDLSKYTSSTIGLNDSNDTTFSLPNVSATWLVSLYWGGATGIASVPAVSTGGEGSTKLTNTWAPSGGSQSGFFLAAGTSAGISAVYTTTATSTPSSTSNKVVISGMTSMTDGNLDIFVVRLPNSLVTLLTPLADRVGQDESRLVYLEEQLRQLSSAVAAFSSPSVCVSPDECKEEEESSVTLRKSGILKALGIKP